ncbi:hypothetical protein DTO96_102425 [Ephemeroptericola cinctiostellae]|uniref:Uncharacterized protein n=1 Tax=Ephemeroptericola cinctiostellae TaxID=2268024 RepID=A0A345DE82_9BURK|nr:hypothetical protein DTO96_102425 [Ephemeroptericola cinctiostellae]
MKTLFLFLITLSWYVHQNRYFGWNEAPQSQAECLADGLTYVLFSMALLSAKCRKQPKDEKWDEK